MESLASRVTFWSLVIVLSSEMSRSPSPDHLSLSAGSWKSETSLVKTVKSVIQHLNVKEPIATSSPKQRETRWDNLLIGPRSGLPHLRVARIHPLIGPISALLPRRLDVSRHASRIM